jgi:hypothetical protein
MIPKIKKFTDGTSFTNALKNYCGCSTCFIVLLLRPFQNWFYYRSRSFFYPSDIPSNLKHRTELVTVLIVSGVNLLINPLSLGFLSFFYFIFPFNDFSVRTKGNYGFIFSFASHLVGFCSFANRLGQDSIFRINTFRRFILPHCFFNFLFISDRTGMLNTNCRMHKVNLEVFTTQRLMGLESDRKKSRKQLNLQVQLNTIHENIREILIRNRTTSGSSNQNRKLLVFISLVEIMGYSYYLITIT